MNPNTERLQRVAAYCRVSTDKDDQVNSLESQQRYFRDYIERNPFWSLTEVYVDEGITGTSTKKRKAFNRMLADAESGAFDLIITKEISRFARNTLDSILYTRKLKEMGIGVIFMNDNINTLDADAELRLTIMSSIAQEESRKTSDRVKWGQKRRMELGVVFGRDMLGYDVCEGKLQINEQGAEIVRLIFHKFVNEDKGTHVIARELREAGIPTATYMKTWSNTVILRVLRNEKYCGDLVQKKTFTPNYLTHEKKYNRGEEEFITIRDHHEPIISRELFERAQEELRRRSPSEEQKAKHSNRYCFSGKIKCGICGGSFVSRTKKRKDLSVYKAWRCHEGAKHGSPHVDKAGNQVGCSCRSLNDEDAKWMLQEIVRDIQGDTRKTVAHLTTVIAKVLGNSTCEDQLTALQNKQTQISEKKQRLLDLYLNQDISKQDFQTANAKCDQEALIISVQLENFRAQAELKQNQAAVMTEISDTLNNLASGNEWDDMFYRHLLQQITVYDDSRIDICLNLLPATWRFLRAQNSGRNLDASVSTQNAGPKSRMNTGFSEPVRNLDASLPISVRIAFSSG